MAEFKLKKGYDIPIAGQAEKLLKEMEPPKKAAVQPQEFLGIKPKLAVEEGTDVKIGTVLFSDKLNPEVKFVSPLSGKVVEIKRGDRRAIVEVVVESDGKNTAEKVGDFNADSVKQMDREQLIAHLLAGGMWPLIKKRPFDKIANHAETPRDIFISGFDTAPLAADPEFLVKDEDDDFQMGIDVLNKLTEGKVYLSLNGKSKELPSALKNAKNIEINSFSGPHPAGNVGVQIHHLNPLKRGEMVWTLSAYAVVLIGKFFQQGYFVNERIVATAGSSLKQRQYYKTIVGAPISALITENNVVDDKIRYISGDILTGRKTTARSYVSFSEPLITVIPERKEDRKLLGYFLPGFKTPSHSKTYFSSLIPQKEYVLDTSFNGGKRAFVQSGDYERVIPMDILPVHLVKSIMADDIEEMEGLGILELSEEDIALCSYICLSKTDFGGLLRQGLDLLEREG